MTFFSLDQARNLFSGSRWNTFAKKMKTASRLYRPKALDVSMFIAKKL